MLIEVKHFTKVHLDVDKLRAHMEAAMGHHIHVNNKVPGSRKDDLKYKGLHTERGTSIKDVCTNILDMVVIQKNWQALPVSATTITLGPGIEVRAQPTPEPTYTPSPDNIQRPTVHLNSKPDLVELPEINHDEPNEPQAGKNIYSNTPPLVRPKKKSLIIQQQGLLDQFSLNSSSLMIGRAVIASLVFLMSARAQ